MGARESAAREADLFGIFCWRSTKNARRLTGHDIARRQLRHSHAVRASASAFTTGPIYICTCMDDPRDGAVSKLADFNWTINWVLKLYSSCSPDPVYFRITGLKNYSTRFSISVRRKSFSNFHTPPLHLIAFLKIINRLHIKFVSQNAVEIQSRTLVWIRFQFQFNFCTVQKLYLVSCVSS